MSRYLPRWLLAALGTGLLVMLAAIVGRPAPAFYIASVDPASSTVEIVSSGERNAYKVDAETIIRIDDRQAKLEELRKSDAVAVTYRQVGTEIVVVEIRALRQRRRV